MRLALVAGAFVTTVGPGQAQDAGSRYAAAYFLTGFRLRATVACPNSSGKDAVERAFAPVSSPELRAVSKAYPDTTKKWMMEGANAFNTGVMQDGLGAACAQPRR